MIWGYPSRSWHHHEHTWWTGSDAGGMSSTAHVCCISDNDKTVRPSVNGSRLTGFAYVDEKNARQNEIESKRQRKMWALYPIGWRNRAQYSQPALRRTYSTADALWLPSERFGGLKPQSALSKFPKDVSIIPSDPAWSLLITGEDSCQHWMVDILLIADIAVRFNGGAGDWERIGRASDWSMIATNARWESIVLMAMKVLFKRIQRLKIRPFGIDALRWIVDGEESWWLNIYAMLWNQALRQACPKREIVVYSQ